MKGWSGTGFPLALILTLAALTAWLRQAVELPMDGRDGKHRHDPDYIVEGARITRLNEKGQLAYTMSGEKLVHYPDDDSTEIIRPQMVYLNPQRVPVTLASQRADISADGARVVLRGDVELRRAATARQPALLARMDRLTVFPDDERAVTDSLVAISQGKSWVRGTGMEFDNEAQRFVLKSRVTGSFEPTRLRKPEAK